MQGQRAQEHGAWHAGQGAGDRLNDLSVGGSGLAKNLDTGERAKHQKPGERGWPLRSVKNSRASDLWIREHLRTVQGSMLCQGQQGGEHLNLCVCEVVRKLISMCKASKL